MDNEFVPKNMKEAIEIVEKFNLENKFRDGGLTNNAIQMLIDFAKSGTESASAMDNIKVATYFYIGESAANRMEDDINDFIENKNIIDIKFQVCHNKYVLYTSVLIIYKED